MKTIDTVNAAAKKIHEPQVDLDLALEHGLTEEEYGRVLAILGRVPTYTELGIFSVMWSEHCSYKNSISLLKTLPRSGGRLLVSAGEENAGLVDIGGGYAVAFKIESHNHPSAVEPYQGAATGVGGIMRDIFTMGARPIAALNSLRFGSLEDDRTKYLVKGVVKGIGDYGNSFGVPTVAGEVYFDKCYQENPLVNAMAVGLVKHGEWASATAKGVGNPVVIVGSATGRDGIHGATFASEEISEESSSKRPSVQVGDPFTEKLLLEATLEAIRTGYVVGIQDMGAAGLTCSTSEMSARGGCGMKINLDSVPAREEGMTAYELMLSESQERMLMVVEKGKEREIFEIFRKWDLEIRNIGGVTSGGRVVVEHEGQQVADIPAHHLVLGGGAPVYRREAKEPGYIKQARAFDIGSLNHRVHLEEVLLKLLASPSIASKRWVFQQYDSMVRTNSLAIDGTDAGVVLVKEANKALSLKTDCNSRYVYLNPWKGAAIAVAEAARNVVCTGGTPLAITNCLNFGNPYNPEIYWQFAEAVRGIGDACRAFGTPVTGGNVSFYNESREGPVYPTPVIGMLGLIDNPEHVTTSSFKDPGDRVLLLGETAGQLGGSEYLHRVHGVIAGDAPEIDLEIARSVHEACLEAIANRLVKSAHDCSDGGLAVAVAESCIQGSIGADLDLGVLTSTAGRVGALFGEDQSRIILTVEPSNVQALQRIASVHHVAITEIGKLGGTAISFRGLMNISVADAARVYGNALGDALQ